MNTSLTMQGLIKGFEGCCLNAYKCPAGVWTIGYGHTGSDVHSGLTTSKAQAEAMFQSDLKKHERQLSSLMARDKVELTQQQFDALSSFVFNLGIGKLQTSTLWKKVKADATDKTIPQEIMRWCYSGGVKLDGLVRRRSAEAKYWQTGKA